MTKIGAGNPKTYDEGVDDAIVLLDTNIWFKEKLLRTAAGATLIATVRAHGWRIAVPEVVERELRALVGSEQRTAMTHVRDALQALKTWQGAAPAIQFPKEKDNGADERFHELKDLLIRVPLTENHRRIATERVLLKVAPTSDGRESYKDQLVWQAVRELAEEQRVYFISGDKDFYADSDRRHLNSQLEIEARFAEGVTTYSGLSGFNEAYAREVQFLNKETMLVSLTTALKKEVESFLQEESGMVGDRVGDEIMTYATEQPGVFALDFTMTFIGTVELDADANVGDRVSAVIRCYGSAFYRADSDGLHNIDIDEVDVSSDAATYSYFTSNPLPAPRMEPYSLVRKRRLG